MKKLIVLLALCGCAKTPTEHIIDNHVQHIDDVLDYSYNNIDQTQDIVFLENELKSCKNGLLDAQQSYKAEIATCESKTSYWRLSTFGLLFAIIMAVFLRIKRII